MPFTIYRYVPEHLWGVLRNLIVNTTVSQWTLEDAAGKTVKSGMWETVGTVSAGDGKVYIICTMRDTSTDSYTFRSIVAWCELEGMTVRICEYDFGTDITKGSDQTLRIDLKISISPILL